MNPMFLIVYNHGIDESIQSIASKLGLHHHPALTISSNKKEQVYELHSQNIGQ
jgi:hypothetical protein